MNRLKRLTAGEKNRITILFLATLIALYFGLRYPPLNADLTHQSNMVDRKINRIELRKEVVPRPAVSANKLRTQLAELDGEIVELRGRLAALDGVFASIDSNVELQALWLDVSALARQSGLDVLNMQGYGSAGSGGSPITSAEALQQETNNRYKRPLVTLSANGSFPQIMAFLRALKTLRHNVAVVRLGLQAKNTQPAKEEDVSPAQPLSISLVLAM